VARVDDAVQQLQVDDVIGRQHEHLGVGVGWGGV
jgi:hypothetical protein